MLLLFTVLILLFPALILLIFKDKQIIRVRHLLSIPLLLNVVLAVYFYPMLQHDSLNYSVTWSSSLGIGFNLSLDYYSWFFYTLITGIGFLIFLYAAAYMKTYEGFKRFFVTLYVFTAAMVGTVLASDLITMFIFWELTSLCSFILIGFNHNKYESRSAAQTALLITAFGGLALLTAVIYLGSLTGSYQTAYVLEQLQYLEINQMIAVVVLLVIAAFSKSAQFPLHFWLPGAMQAPTPVSAFLHSATMVKLGLYLLFRFMPMIGNEVFPYYILIIAGATTMLLGSFSALFHSDLKKILAYTTISALGTVVLLIGIDTKMALKGALIFLLVHALYKASLFMLAGIIDKLTGTRDVNKVHVSFKKHPVFVIIFTLSVLSMAGLPPMLGFIGKEVMYDAKYQASGIFWFILALTILSNIFMVYLSMMLFIKLFASKTPQKTTFKKSVYWDMISGPTILALVALILGVFPQTLNKLFSMMLFDLSYAEVKTKFKLWHGFNTVLLLSAITVTLGILLYKIRNIAIDKLQSVYKQLFTLNFAEIFQRAVYVFLDFAQRQTNRIQHGVHRFYLMVIFITMVIIIGAQLIMHDIKIPVFNTGNITLLTAIVTFIMTLASVVIVFTRSRLVSVIALGIIGYGIAMFFMTYGAIDLAITQIIVDTLTMIIFVIVLQKLPRFSVISSLRSRVRDGIIALSVGTTITLLLLKADAFIMQKPISYYFAENSLPKGKGQNIVNVILVDFRALDTLGEITVLAAAALGIITLLNFTVKSKTHE